MDDLSNKPQQNYYAFQDDANRLHNLNNPAPAAPNPFAQAAQGTSPLNQQSYNAQLTPEQLQQQQAMQQGAYAQQAGNVADVQQAQQAMQNQLGEMPVASVNTVKASASDFEPPVSKPTSTGGNLESNYLSSLQNAYAQQEKGINAAAMATAQKAAAEAAQLEEQDKLVADRIKKVDDIQQKSQLAAKEASDNLARTAEDIANFKGSINPDNFWQNKSTGDKVMAGIAIALGALGQGISAQAGIKTTNGALDIINAAIDRDMQAQKENMASQMQRNRDKAGIQSNLLSEMHKQFDDSLQAENAARFLMLDQAERKLKAITSKYEAPAVLAKRDQLLGQLGEEKAKSLYEVQNSAAQKEATRSLLSGTGDFRNLNPEQVNKLGKDYADRYVPGYGFGLNKESVGKFQEKRAEIEPAINGADRILQLSKDYNRVTDLSKRAAIQSEMKALAGQLRVPLTGPGALTDKEFDRLMETIGDPTALVAIPSIQRRKLETVKNKLKTDLSNSARQYGLTPNSVSDSIGFTPRK